VALDGTKMKANASKHKAMSCRRSCNSKRSGLQRSEKQSWRLKSRLVRTLPAKVRAVKMESRPRTVDLGRPKHLR